MKQQTKSSPSKTEDKEILVSQIKVYEATISKLKQIESSSKAVIEELRQKVNEYDANLKSEKTVSEQFKNEGEQLKEEIVTLQADVKRREDLTKELNYTITEIRAELANTTLALQKLEKSSETTERAMQSELSELKAKNTSEIAKLNVDLTNANEEIEKINKAFDLQKQELESKNRQVERLEEFVSVAKSINENLKIEKESLLKRISDAEVTNEKLKNLVETSSTNYLNSEDELKKITKEKSKMTEEIENLKAKLFHQLALSMKLDSIKAGIKVNNKHIAELWDEGRTLPEREWHRFISDALLN